MADQDKCAECKGRGWHVGECHPREECGKCEGTGLAGMALSLALADEQRYEAVKRRPSEAPAIDWARLRRISGVMAQVVCDFIALNEVDEEAQDPASGLWDAIHLGREAIEEWNKWVASTPVTAAERVSETAPPSEAETVGRILGALICAATLRPGERMIADGLPDHAATDALRTLLARIAELEDRGRPTATDDVLAIVDSMIEEWDHIDSARQALVSCRERLAQRRESATKTAEEATDPDIEKLRLAWAERGRRAVTAEHENRQLRAVAAAAQTLVHLKGWSAVRRPPSDPVRALLDALDALPKEGA